MTACLQCTNFCTIALPQVTPGDVPFPWSEKDPYRLPVSIDRVQKMLVTLGERLLYWGSAHTHGHMDTTTHLKCVCVVAAGVGQ